MLNAAPHPTLASSPAPGDAPIARAAEGSEEVRWLPPERMARYQAAKIIGSLFFIAIFAGWLYIQWSNPTMRLFAIALLTLTAWLTIKSIIADALRSRGRVITVTRDALRVTQPGNDVEVRLADVSHGEWREETEDDFGLALVSPDGRRLARLDHVFLADQAEARMFLNWLRKHSGATFDVRWPEEK